MSDDILDDTEGDESVPNTHYDITSYGVDFDVDGLVRRLEKEKVRVPAFQRSYVWTLPEASRFIESILLGLPVPGIFLAKEPRDEALLVIDGQQRLKSLQFFKTGIFNPKKGTTTNRVFKLERVYAKYEGKTYETLDEVDRRIFDDSVIHATVIKQESPQDDDTSIYHVFERLNSGGQKLTPQEIRTAAYHGEFINLIKTLNEDSNWRALFGAKSARLKDEELIVRFFALAYDLQRYERPMAEFLSKFVQRHRKPSQDFLDKAGRDFRHVVSIMAAMGPNTVRPERAFNAAVFDALAVAIFRGSSQKSDIEKLKLAQGRLLKDKDFSLYTSRATADETSVNKRIEIAKKTLIDEA